MWQQSILGKGIRGICTADVDSRPFLEIPKYAFFDSFDNLSISAALNSTKIAFQFFIV